MLIELGNHAAVKRESNAAGVSRSVGIHDDGIPRVSRIHIPEADEGGLGGYSHAIGQLSAADYKGHIAETLLMGRPTRLPDHEALLAITHAWPAMAIEPPAWLEVTPGPLTPPGVAEDIEAILHDFYRTEGKRKPLDVEERYWTKAGPPGAFPKAPDITALFTDVGRAFQATAMGGGATGLMGTGTAASSSTFTTASTLVTNAWAGYRLYVRDSAGVFKWGNIISNTNSASSSVITIDRWYTLATPGGAAAGTPTGFDWFIADGGMVSAWFVALSTTNISPAHGDTSLSGEYTTASGGFLRKIAPYALTSGVSPMHYTLTPVYTGNGSDTYPSTFYAIGVFTSMVVADVTDTMIYETSLSASATVAASGDQVTVTETITGS